jgi:hypothetical protein
LRAMAARLATAPSSHHQSLRRSVVFAGMLGEIGAKAARYGLIGSDPGLETIFHQLGKLLCPGGRCLGRVAIIQPFAALVVLAVDLRLVWGILHGAKPMRLLA